MLITPRRGTSRSGVGIAGSLVVIVGGACAFLLLLQDYTQATMSRPAPVVDSTAFSTAALFVSEAQRACFQPAPPEVSSEMKRIVLTQLVAVRTGDDDAAQRCINIPAQGVCPLHLQSVLNTCKRVATAPMFDILSTRISHDQNTGVVYARVASRNAPSKIAMYSLVLNEGRWRIQTIELNHVIYPPRENEFRNDWRQRLYGSAAPASQAPQDAEMNRT